MTAQRGASRVSWIIPGLALLALAAAVIGLSIGAFPVTFDGFFRALRNFWSGDLPQTAEQRVLFGIRGPRVLAGLIVGASLAGAGVVYQGLFRNPLVSHDVLGVSAGAGLGAVIGIFLSLPVFTIQMLAFGGGLATVACLSDCGGCARP